MDYLKRKPYRALPARVTQITTSLLLGGELPIQQQAASFELPDLPPLDPFIQQLPPDDDQFDQPATTRKSGGGLNMNMEQPANQLTAVSITLTALDADDKRYIHVHPGKPVLVGRASNSKSESEKIISDNALFICKVMSSSHAELKTNVWKRGQVTITDTESMRRKAVNGKKLVSASPYPLKSGDVVKFGQEVTCGHKTDYGLELAFKIIHNPFDPRYVTNIFEKRNLPAEKDATPSRTNAGGLKRKANNMVATEDAAALVDVAETPAEHSYHKFKKPVDNQKGHKPSTSRPELQQKPSSNRSSMPLCPSPPPLLLRR
ncbi:hypothetical protein LTR50_007354 [Elasticomyces elasticus]|nr:hypothetical protein LTR50_007354 [Elasticomyces elasticus]